MTDVETPLTNTQTIASELPSDNRFGQNGYLGPSSVPMDKQPSASISATAPNDPALAIVKRDGAAMPGTIIERPLNAAHGHRDRNDEQHAKVPTGLRRK